MRIESGLPSYYINMPQNTGRAFAPAEPQKMSYANGNFQQFPGVIVDISQQAKDAYNKSIADPAASGESQGIGAAQELEGCQTCKSRKYVDESNDSSVSYQTPTHISPGQSAGKVRAHEQEHITNDKAKAERDDRRIVSQTVSLSTSICPECGKMYVSGGSARTVTASKNKSEASGVSQTEEKNNTAGEGA